MPDAKQHIAQWQHNRRFAKTIDRTYLDWQVNAIFYTALHFVDAALCSLGLVAANHEKRNELVKTNGSFASVRNQYLNLYRISRITRYDADPQMWLPAEYLTIDDLVENLLKPIEQNLARLIKPPPDVPRLPKLQT
jgi:hypothetical protein